ncbi:glycoside hydrolase family 3 N-terminal domain-containing protein [Dysgonomonas sp. 511]|uniref:glycoside hydrolase family 3 N-terminal domain-containing protein n=1 Tax=Dysgonomonas sp. 511 TaxID=2302930 RepID=UPI0013D4523C|nr:glycoside hydrolase family 3 N-terminal domain-containing protein [Dysgonomonas sp. 511]NDV79183.1 beta-glucosidase [Dysgonomonas sp. 511]
MKRIYLMICLACACTAMIAQGKKDTPVYKDANRPVEERVNDLLKRMTLEEKVMQLNQYTLGRNDNVNNVGEAVKNIPAELGSVIYFSYDPKLRNEVQRKAMEESRLGIPLIYGYDVIHGFRTVYPIPLAQACSWNPELVQQASAVAAQEARMSGVDWTFSPMIDVARDGRWGRVAEGYGEDPHTNAVFAVASVKGYQGDNMASDKNVAACLKHFVGYGASEGGRDYVFTEISRQTLWDTYMQPYIEGVKAGAATLMSCFNDISGTPGTANPYILREVLKGKWGHDGFVVSDWGAIEQLRPQGVAADKKEAALKAFTAGVEMDMMNNCYNKHLGELVSEGLVSMEMLDDAVRRVLRVKFRLGLFERPYTPESTEKERFYLAESLRVAEQLAEESIVLLKNENNILPLQEAKDIAVVGPMGDTRWHLLGSWAAHGDSERIVPIASALKEEFEGKASVTFAKGCDFDGEDSSGFEEALQAARKADVVVVALGEKKNWSGENASRSTIALPDIQLQLLKEISKTGKPIVLVLSSGRPIELGKVEASCKAIVQMWQPGISGAKPIAGVLSGRVNPSGKLAITYPYASGQIPIYYNQRKSARPHQGKYQDIPNTPLYEFGHGLSYTSFEYGKLKASASSVSKDGRVTVEVPVTNTGDRDGLETVHWFITDPVASISRPVKELKHFEKKLIRKGETVVFRFEITPMKDIAFLNHNGDKILEKGKVYISVKDERVELDIE